MFPNCLRLLKAYKIKLLWIYDLGEGGTHDLSVSKFSIPPAGWDPIMANNQFDLLFTRANSVKLGQESISLGDVVSFPSAFAPTRH